MIIFIYGPDTFRSREKLREVIQQFQVKRDTVGLNLVRLDGADLEFDRLRQEVMTQGFLSPKKMIVVEGLLASNNQKLLEDTLELVKKQAQEQHDNVLVFYEADFNIRKKSKADQAASKLFTLLKKQKYSFEFPLLSGSKLNTWIRQRVIEQGGTIKAEVASELAVLVDSNLHQLANDIDKLVAYRQDREITAADIEENVRGNFEANIFALTDAVAEQNQARALRLLTQAISAGAHEIYLLTMITRQFRILLQIKDKLENTQAINPGNLAGKLKLHPFVVKKSVPAAKKYSLGQLKDIYQRLLNIDLNLKTSHPNPQLLLDLLIIDQE